MRKKLNIFGRNTYHELRGGCALDQALFYQGIGEYDLCELDGQVIFVGCPVLRNRRPNTNGRHRYILPDVSFWTTNGWTQAQQLAVLFYKVSELSDNFCAKDLLTSSEILLKRSSTFRGLRSS